MTAQSSGVQLPSRAPSGPLAAIGRRLAIALGLVLVNWVLVILERHSFRDSADGNVSVVDALYYTTVTLTTTGYGDITPVTTGARLVNALIVTPMRLLFVVVLVGTTIQALTERSRQEFWLTRWRSRLTGHTVVCGYGTKGRNAARALLLQGRPHDQIVVVDDDPQAVAAATAAGFVAVLGAATQQDVLHEAMIDRAAVVMVAVDRDDTAVLVTLTVRRMAPQATVVATAREAENAALLKQSGASSVIVSSETAGRLLGLATTHRDTVAVVEDLLSFGSGLDLAEREVLAAEVGKVPAELPMPVLAVVRDGGHLAFDDPQAAPLRAGDFLVYAQAATRPAPAG